MWNFTLYILCLIRLHRALTSTNTSPRCKYVEDGKWDDSIQKCIDEHCSTEEEVEDGCVEGLQAWIDAESVDVNDFSIVDRVDLPVCNKAGGNEAAVTMG